jgi:hypothetical protein
MINLLNYNNPLLFRPFGSILGAPLTPVRHTQGIKSSTHNMIANTWQVLYPATANQYNRVLLKIMADTGNIRGNLDSIG